MASQASSVSQVRQLFGTDGMRGVAGEFPLNAITVFALGEALGSWAATHTVEGASPQVIVGMDTRESGPWLAEALAAGLARQNVSVRFAGLITTPGVAWLTRTGPFAAGVMISASHNPFQDNGIKIFDHSGFKIADEIEYEFEQQIFALLKNGSTPQPFELTEDPGLDHQYVDFLRTTFPHPLAGKTVVLDCANGASAHLAPELFQSLGANVIAIGCEPNGRNINLNCGALHVEDLRDRVIAENADYGFAFDGDADRCIGVTAAGRIIDGDAMLLVCARHLQSTGELGNSVVSTVMSNLGFEKALERNGIQLLRTGVGDKYVLEEMTRKDILIGGEQSGHVIFRQFATTGDGILTALRVLDASLSSGQTLDESLADLEIYPQQLVNLTVREKRPLEELPSVLKEIQEAEAEFDGKGRVLVRYSGTERKIRVMVEGADATLVEKWVKRIADAIRTELS